MGWWLTCVSLPRHGTGCKWEGWIEPSRKVVVFDLLGLVVMGGYGLEVVRLILTTIPPKQRLDSLITTRAYLKSSSVA